MLPNLLEFGEHLLIKLNKKITLILGNNPTLRLEFVSFRDYLMNARGAFAVLREVVGNF